MSLAQQKVVVLAYPGYQELDFWYPVLRSREEGAEGRAADVHRVRAVQDGFAADLGGFGGGQQFKLVGEQ